MSKNESKTAGNYLRIIGSGEIVKWKNFSEITQLYEIELADGKISTIQSNRVSTQVTPEQVAEFVRLHDQD